ncbi:MAG: hypothetical protein U9N35_01950 [Euryarchaeota archaeon]|nr:hypothetical protein [Euryarchaeota archaeon]
MENIDFEEINEEWNEYRLDDGSTLKVKLVLQKVVRLDKYDNYGEPVYRISHQIIVRVTDVPEELKKEVKEEDINGAMGVR